MAITKGPGCLRRTGLDEERVRVRQRHCKVVQLAHDPANLAKRLTKINLGVARCVRLSGTNTSRVRRFFSRT